MGQSVLYASGFAKYTTDCLGVYCFIGPKQGHASDQSLSSPMWLEEN